jgi:hypothetical protein
VRDEREDREHHEARRREAEDDLLAREELERRRLLVRAVEVTAAKAIGSYIASKGLPVDNLDIDFDANTSTVTVSGTVPDQETREKVVVCCGNVASVQHVNDQLKVANACQAGDFYTVQKGDTLSEIAMRHYGAANKTMKRLANLVMNLDMNVIITAHAKAEYGQNLAKIGYTFDGWRQLDYWFDLVCELGKKGKKRFAKVVKTRIETFPDEDVFEWSYDAIKKRYDASILERQAQQVALATPEQVREVKELLNIVRLPEGLVDKWFNKAQVDTWEDMPAETILKCIGYVKDRLPGGVVAA